MMYELMVCTHFDAAHSLDGYPGECARLHGHTFKIDVIVDGETLNSIGLVYDFKDLKSAVQSVLEIFDHRHMNEIEPFDKISPTAENIARFIFFEVPKHVANKDGTARVRIKRVNVWESESACISFFER